MNPRHYRMTFRGRPDEADTASYVQAIVDKAAELDIQVLLAITDHNSVSSAGVFRSVARNRGIHVFPGFELSSAEGVHLLCLYPPNADDEQLGRFLGEFGIRDTIPSSDLANKSFVDLLACVRSQGGISIGAHMTNGGLWKVLGGQARIRAWQDENLLSVQIPGPVEDLPQEVCQIVENRNPDYHRARVPENGVAIAVVNARDVASPDDLNNPSVCATVAGLLLFGENPKRRMPQGRGSGDPLTSQLDSKRKPRLYAEND